MAVHLALRIAQTIGLGLIDLLALLGLYSGLRWMRISLEWATVLAGLSLIVIGGLFGVTASLVQSQFGSQLQILSRGSNLMGMASFFVALYSFSQWTMRGWYLFVKRQAKSRLTEGSRGLLLFLRQHHVLFGWVVLITACAHALWYVPVLMSEPLAQIWEHQAISSGLIALLLLIMLSLLGLWVERAIKQKRLPRSTRLIHFFTAIVFVVAVCVHLIIR